MDICQQPEVSGSQIKTRDFFPMVVHSINKNVWIYLEIITLSNHSNREKALIILTLTPDVNTNLFSELLLKFIQHIWCRVDALAERDWVRGNNNVITDDRNQANNEEVTSKVWAVFVMLFLKNDAIMAWFRSGMDRAMATLMLMGISWSHFFLVTWIDKFTAQNWYTGFYRHGYIRVTSTE